MTAIVDRPWIFACSNRPFVSITYQIEKSNPDEKNRGNKRDPILKDHSKQGLFLDQILQVRIHAHCSIPRPLPGWRKIFSSERKIRLYEESSFDRKSVDPSEPEHEEHERE